jgi:hypothetical protein
MRIVMDGSYLILCFLVVMGLGLFLGMVAFSPNARLRRRRRKSHSPLISRGKGPAIQLSVKVPKDDT